MGGSTSRWRRSGARIGMARRPAHLWLTRCRRRGMDNEARSCVDVDIGWRRTDAGPATIVSVSLPIDPLLPEILDHLRQANTLVLEAPPGAGKTTRVPPALLQLTDREVLVLEPRRLAARLAARFAATKLAERVGETV